MSTPGDLEARGREIWSAFGADQLPAGHRALVHEIARSADTLDRLDALVVGKRDVWVELMIDDVGSVTLSVDSLLSERRQQQANLQRLLAEARQAGLKQDETAKPKSETEGRGGIVLQLRGRVN
jgi:hypothetical protein